MPIRQALIVLLIVLLLLWLAGIWQPGAAEEPEPVQGCASSIWQNPDGSYSGPFVSCEPYRLVLPLVGMDGREPW